MGVGLGALDYVLLAASLVLSALIGFYFTNKNKSIKSYMLGDRQLSLFPVAISLMTSVMSGLTLLGASAEIYYQGPAYTFVIIPILLCGPITAYTILPVIYRLNELSLYCYLKKRFGPFIEFIVCSIYILQMIFFNAVVLYVPSIALHSTVGISRQYSILAIGLMCVVYSAIGGLKAVVWTDFFQAMLMYGSIIIVGVIGTGEAGGIAKVFEAAAEGGRLNLDGFFKFDLVARHTFWTIMLGSTIKHVYVVGVNQVQIQRALSLSSLKQGQLAFVFCSIFTALIVALSTYMGLVMYSAYRSCDPFMAHEVPRRDTAIIHFVFTQLGSFPGLRGIFVAGVFSATLSTLSSFANSMAALTLENFIKPLMQNLGHKELTESKATWTAKALATVFGIACVAVAYIVDKANSRLLQVTQTMFGAIGVPFLAAFAMGIFTRFVNSVGILSGFAVTLSLGSYITIYQTFYKPALKPLLPVYYNDQCAKVFNGTMASDLLPSIEMISHWPGVVPIVEEASSFSLSEISYMALPILQMLIMIVVAPLVSLLTGGLQQEIDDKYLVSILHKDNKKSERTTVETSDGINEDSIVSRI